MIKNGNYYHLDWEKYKPKIIESFVYYYGEKYRDIIEKKINDTIVIGYNSYDYICDYYNKFIYKYRDEILEEFYKISHIKRNPKIDEFLLKDSNGFSKLEDALNGVENLDDCLYSKSTIDHLESLRKECIDLFDLNKINDNKEIDYFILRNYYRDYELAVENIENKYSCDVTRDIQISNKQYVDSVKDFIDTCKDLGVFVSEKDFKILSNPKCSVVDVARLDANNALFVDDFRIDGPIFRFDLDTTIAFKSYPESEKRLVMEDRLKYLYYSGQKPKYIDKSQIYDTDDKILSKEYNYQMRLAKNLKNIPSVKTVELLQVLKRQFIEQMVAGTHSVRNIEMFGDPNQVSLYPETNYTSYFKYKDGDINKPVYTILVAEDDDVDEEEFMMSMIHEFNHIIGTNVLKVDGDNVTQKQGLEINEFNLKNGDVNTYIDDYLEDLDENINEDLAKEIYKIFKSMYGLVIHFENDMSIEKYTQGCLYDNYDFITNKFFNSYKDAIKKHYVDPNYNIYFGEKFPTSKFGECLIGLKNIKKVLLPHSYYNGGRLNFRKVGKLNDLITTFRILYNDTIIDGDVSAKDLIKGEYRNLDDDVVSKIEAIRQKAKHIHDSMQQEKEHSNLIR